MNLTQDITHPDVRVCPDLHNVIMLGESAIRQCCSLDLLLALDGLLAVELVSIVVDEEQEVGRVEVEVAESLALLNVHVHLIYNLLVALKLQTPTSMLPPSLPGQPMTTSEQDISR